VNPEFINVKEKMRKAHSMGQYTILFSMHRVKFVSRDCGTDCDRTVQGRLIKG